MNASTMLRESIGRRRLRKMACEQLERRDLLLATLKITEINYAPYEPVAAFGDISQRSGDYEFLEILNDGHVPVPLAGVRLVEVDFGGGAEGVDYTFGPDELQPGDRVVVVDDVDAFMSRYGSDVNLAGSWRGRLARSETLTLIDADDSIIQQFAYGSDGDWPTRAAGLGASLELKRPDAEPSDPNSWKNSEMFGGTPGRDRLDVAVSIIVNEVLAHTDLPQVDAIELYNTTGDPVPLAGWYVTDDLAKPYQYSIPAGTMIGVNGYLELDETDFNADGNGFALSERGDDVWLISAQPTGRPLAFVDHAQFAASFNGVALGRLPNGDASSVQPVVGRGQHVTSRE